MIYYTSDLRKIEYTPSGEPIGSGTQGKVYKYDENRCIKIYDEEVPTINPEIFNIFKDLSLKGYGKLHDLLYSDIDLKKIASYIMDYYKNEVDNILFKETEYTLDSLNILYNSAKILAENKILIKDTIPKNTILEKESIIIIDFDSYKKSGLTTNDIIERNTTSILELFKKQYKEGLKKIGINVDENDELSDYLDSLFYYSKEPTKILTRKMKNVKIPYDLFYKR